MTDQNIDGWIRELANNDPQVERLLWQIIAALFRPNHAFGKAILLYSDSPTGKNASLFLELLKNLVGVEQTATLSFADFEGRHLPENLDRVFADFEGRHLPENLDRVSVVLSDEIYLDDFYRLPKAEKFKKWVAHKKIQVKVKYGPVKEVQGRGICVFCTHELPPAHKRSQLLGDLFIVVPIHEH